MESNLLNRSIIKKELEEKDYFVFNRNQLIETLRDDYNAFQPDVPFEEWVSPVDLDDLKDDKEYVVDGDISFEPVDFDIIYAESVLQKESLHSHTTTTDYLDNIVVTKKGLESNSVENDKGFDYYSFTDLEDYLSIEEYERFDQAHEKISNQNVDVAEPFLEVSVHGREHYINLSELSTEKDIIDFVNSTFDKSGLDREAKTFDRKSIQEKAKSNKNAIYHRNYEIER